MSDEIPKFKKPQKASISISVDKESLEELRKFINKHNTGAPLSVPFDSWLQDFISKIPKIEEMIEERKRKEEKKEEQVKEGGETKNGE